MQLRTFPRLRIEYERRENSPKQWKVQPLNPAVCRIVELQVAVERVYGQPLSVSNSVDQGKIQGKSGLMGPHSLVGSVENPIPGDFPRIQ